MYGGRSLQGVTELLIREEEISLDENFTLSVFPRFLFLPSFNFFDPLNLSIVLSVSLCSLPHVTYFY
jgi:hypothetical protein